MKVVILAGGLGTRLQEVREYFLSYHAVARDTTVRLADGSATVHGELWSGVNPPWKTWR